MKIGILDCIAGGNIYSVKKAIYQLGYDAQIVKSTKNIDKLIIPGVGSYPEGSNSILPLKDELHKFAEKNMILGICLGMQLFCQKGFEFSVHDGLSLINGECIKLNTNKPLPQIGWNSVEVIRDSKLLKGLEDKKFYFMHSYEVVNYTDCNALTTYEGHKFVASIENKNVFGVQFHPEKSGEAGLELFNNFLKL
jgi:imidazole glycerol-phosphate synthase subunit HisH